MNTDTAKLKENKDHGTSVFPCGLYEVFATDDWQGAKHHWHDEIEILYFAKGRFHVTINMESFSVEEESFYFINPGNLHSIEPLSRGIESAILFRSDILRFEYYDIAQTRLLHPLSKGEIRFPICITPSHPGFSKIKDAYLEILDSFHDTGSFLSEQGQTITENISSQLLIRAGLLKILGTLSSYSLLTEPQKEDDSRIFIIKSSLAFIRSHYQEKIYIHDLAKNANMNEQYFCRFFRKAIGKSPISYINEFRIKQAILLLQTTDMPVMDICLECGFNNLGNFLREFKKNTGFTPLQYRKHFKKVTIS